MSDKLPDGWRWVKLGDVCEMGSGGTPNRGTAAYFGGDIPWVIIGDLNDGIVTHTRQTITDLGLANSSAKLVPAGAILVAMYGSIGKLGIAGAELTTNQAIAHLVPHTVLDPYYLFQYLRADRERLATAGAGMAQSNISQTVLKGWDVPLPPLDEQRRIVARLEGHLATAERARSAALAQLAAIEAMPQALLRQIFPRSPGSPLRRTWRWAKLGEVCEVEKGRTPKKSWYAPTGVWLVHYRDVTTHRITWTAGRNTFVAPEYESSLKELEPGTVLVGADAHDPATIGKKVTLVDTVPQHASPAYFAGEMLGIRPNAQRSIEPAIVWHWLRSEAGYEEMQQNVSGGHLNVRPARNVRIPLPPVNEQYRIVQELDEQTAAIERARAAAQARLDAIEALPTAALRLAFTP